MLTCGRCADVFTLHEAYLRLRRVLESPLRRALQLRPTGY